ncbi:hypothetical protein H6F43_21190 [Leptolyngbya sp. FACHB-36]|uniref:hypothetical protein n=1 Tax=Leptolyngbya sp. FACHB-36 TaxID=2692808 RepID=UPI001681479D|nr:hypothetical protein [Leptolyngbya sp. FACHB-36]MBD2022700.1 hypothetical protein [Leptolyngbya sp. FACHB-36]
MELEQQESEHDQERCLERLSRAVQQLAGWDDRDRIARTAELIIQTMTGPWRYFHTPEHIFEVGERGDAIEVLAALFHDLVYVQVDQGVSVNISRYISPFVKEIDGQLVIRDRCELPDDRLFDLVSQIFGFVSGERLLPTAGQNEFLSALIAAKCLEHALTPAILAEIAACIEATIPFRGRSVDGLAASDRLYERLKQVNPTFGLGWDDAKLCSVLERCVRLANRDVENFAYPSAADFLDNTWNLLPETNHDLKNANSYTVSGYRVSLQKMEGFMYFLKPDLVFQRFQNEPDKDTYEQLISHTHKNLEVARLYLGSKLLSIAVIEALSLRLGRDIPLATMMGELPFLGRSVAQLENFLPSVTMLHSPTTELEWNVLSLLEKGRSQSSSYDIKNSPVATFIIKSIGFAAARRLLVQAKEFFKGELEPEAFLAMCDRDVVETIINGVVQVLESRKAAMRGLNVSSRV